MSTNTSTSSPASSPPTPHDTHSLQCPAVASNIDSPRWLSSSASAANFASLSIQTGPLAPVDIMSTTSTETTPSAVNEVAKNEHTISLLWILPELYLLLSHKPATSFLTHPWQSNHCSTSDQTQQHDPLIFHSLPTQHLSTTAHTQQLGQTSTLPGPRLPPRPSKLTLKTFSTKSLPMQTTTFNDMNAENLDICTNPPPPIHHSSTVMRSSANSIVKTWYLSLSPLPLTPGHDLAQCYSHSSPPPTIHVKNLGASHILTTNIIDPMPTSCTNAPPNHHAHSGSSHPQISDGCNLHHKHDGRSLVTLILHPHQASILYNSSDISKAYSEHNFHHKYDTMVSYSPLRQCGFYGST